jgi:hypothetical protein
VPWSDLNNGYGVTQFYHGAVFPGGETYFGGTQDNGTVRGNDDDGPQDWVELLGGDGGFVALKSASILYAENFGLSFQKSTNGGLSWQSMIAGISNDAFLFITPFAQDPSNADTLYIVGRKVWRTTNGAGQWKQASKQLVTSAEHALSAIGIARTNRNVVLVGSTAGDVYRTTKALTGTASTAWAKSRPRAGYVSWIAVDPTNAKVVYATYANFGGVHVWKSVNGGGSWAPLDGLGARIPDVPVHTIAVDPANPLRLYVGTDLGVFSSLDGGLNWFVENTGFANVFTIALVVHQQGPARTLYGFTHGRGAWRVALP